MKRGSEGGNGGGMREGECSEQSKPRHDEHDLIRKNMPNNYKREKRVLFPVKLSHVWSDDS